MQHILTSCYMHSTPTKAAGRSARGRDRARCAAPGGRTGKLRQAREEGRQPGPLDDEHAARVEPAAAADHVGRGAGRQRGRAPRREAAHQRAVQVQHHRQPPAVRRRLRAPPAPPSESRDGACWHGAGAAPPVPAHSAGSASTHAAVVSRQAGLPALHTAAALHLTLPLSGSNRPHPVSGHQAMQAQATGLTPPASAADLRRQQRRLAVCQQGLRGGLHDGVHGRLGRRLLHLHGRRQQAACGRRARRPSHSQCPTPSCGTRGQGAQTFKTQRRIRPPVPTDIYQKSAAQRRVPELQCVGAASRYEPAAARPCAARLAAPTAARAPRRLTPSAAAGRARARSPALAPLHARRPPRRPLPAPLLRPPGLPGRRGWPGAQAAGSGSGSGSRSASGCRRSPRRPRRRCAASAPR